MVFGLVGIVLVCVVSCCSCWVFVCVVLGCFVVLGGLLFLFIVCWCNVVCVCWYWLCLVCFVWLVLL